jgi:hypothetical protein
MLSPCRILIPVLLVCCILAAGCTSLFDEAGKDANVTTVDRPIPAGYKVTIAQPDARSAFITMDSDVYNSGEVVEFTVTNTGLLPLKCSHTPPGFVVKFQTGSGRWATKMGADNPAIGNTSYLQKGESTPSSQFISTALEPGRYRIVSDCGVERDFLIRVQPTVTLASAVCPPANATNTTPWIKIDPIGDPVASRPFTIQGTTNLPAGAMLNYTIFSVTSQQQAVSLVREASFIAMVEEGSCGTNTWTAMGEIQATGDFFIGITDATHKATAIKRFRVDS